ncbi:MAG: acetyl-CoA carboxylase biotin carboxylase subunit [Nanoarchaeota archaeon]
MKPKGKKVELLLNQALTPFAKAYGLMWKGIKKARKSMPELYDNVSSILNQNVVSLDKKKNGFTEAIVNSLIRKLPTLGDENLTKIINGSSPKSFFDMLNMSLGATIEKEKDYTKLEKDHLFKSILIANRGEIAIRILRACKDLGIEAVAVYSKPEKDALFVKFADRAYCIGNPNDYLNIKKIINIAKKAKVDAIHPGYGFLSENSEFARLCIQNKVNFIGPSIDSLELMGNKVKARDIITNLGLPIIKGAIKPLKDIKDAEVLAKEIGYPVILKASLGGGGKGMRVVTKKEEIEKAFNSAQAEAKSAFGDSSLYIEKYIVEPRHIEFQILADKFGNVIHLGERDCSIQRRHQKLIEEAPSPALSKELREKMGNAACKVVSEIGYHGAGTVEFLLDKDNDFYFMEMNARIQVEHGVTEMITGVDLVKEQIKIASGGKLSYKQEDIKLTGWAIECRINTEDPFNDFNPSTGTITNYLPPGGNDIRVSSHSHTGQVISHHYDPLIANLICGGKDRQSAITRMKHALNEYIIEGINTNIPFHKLIMNNRDFLKGRITTSFIEKNKIISQLRKQRSKKKELTQKEKTLVITTAVSKYLEKKQRSCERPANWIMAGRQELVNEEIRS